MQIFYVKQIKRYVLIGSVIGFVLGLILRVFLPQFRFQELAFHMWLRNTLGYPLSYYANITLIGLAILCQLFYAILGGAIGFFVFTILHRRQGYTLLVSSWGKRLFGVVFFLLLFLFLRIDMLNPYQEKLAISPIPNIIPSRMTETLKYLFLPSMKFTFNQPLQPIPAAQPQSQPASYTGVSKPLYNAQGPQSFGGAQDKPAQSQTQTSSPNQQSAPVAQPAAQGRMATAQELFAALNSYRQQNGRSSLVWDGTLANFAQQRAATFTRNGGFDNSRGFYEYQTKQSLGFRSTGEVASYSVVNDGNGLISGYFAKYGSTNTVILEPLWQHVGIGVDNASVAIILGTERCTPQAGGKCE